MFVLSTRSVIQRSPNYTPTPSRSASIACSRRSFEQCRKISGQQVASLRKPIHDWLPALRRSLLRGKVIQVRKIVRGKSFFTNGVRAIRSVFLFAHKPGKTKTTSAYLFFLSPLPIYCKEKFRSGEVLTPNVREARLVLDVKGKLLRRNNSPISLLQ